MITIGEFKKFLESASDDTDLSFLLSKIEIPKANFVNHEIPTEMPAIAGTATIKHSCNLGDIIASLPAVKKYYEVTRRKVRYLQRVSMRANYYQGATHGTLDKNGEMVTLNEPMFNMIKPLLESQEYIASMEVYDGQEVNVDFDVIRGKTFANLPHGSIQAWLFYAFPDLYYDISKPWISLPDNKTQIESVTEGKVILNFTERYRNHMIDYFFLKDYAPDLIFAGTELEYYKFCDQFQLNIPRLEVKDFLELAYAIRASKFVYSNQSFIWNLATALGKPRSLEVCQFAQNCMPFYGESSLGYFHQLGASYSFRHLYRITK